MIVKFILAIILLNNTYSFCYSLSIEVGEQGNDIPSCLTEIGPPCHSLEYIADNLIIHDNLIITIISKQIVLSNPVILSTVTNFTLQGSHPDMTMISCRFNNTKVPNSKGAGLLFISSADLTLRNVSIDGCTAKANMLFKSDFHSVLMLNCTNVSIVNIAISKSFGYGLSLVNSNGYILIDGCIFIQNRHQAYWNYNGGSSGLLIHINSSLKVYTAVYRITDCRILNNTANLKRKRWGQIENHGGGMFILLLKGALGNNIQLSNCSFVNNHALLGGGLYFICRSNCNRNIVEVFDSMFNDNNAFYGGGGIDLGYSSSIGLQVIQPFNNSINFVNCVFNRNFGQFGGGVAIFSSTTIDRMDSNKINKIIFNACSFNSNKANGGAAVDINPDVKKTYAASNIVARIKFIDCSFVDNVAGIVSPNSSKITQSGTFFISRISVLLKGNITFIGNHGSALYVSSTNVIFKNANAVFIHNTGEKGAAILLVGLAGLELMGTNSFKFEDNSASYGGAMCAVISETRYFQYTDSCVITTTSSSAHNSFEYINNTATTGIANDIFVSNLYPCQTLYYCKDLASTFNSNCIGNFTFHQPNNSIATATSTIYSPQKTIFAIPGMVSTINISQLDQFGNNVDKLFPLSATLETNTSVKINESYVTLRSNNKIILNGHPGDTATLIIQSSSIAIIKVSMEVKMMKCPPGFDLDPKLLICICANDGSFIVSCNTDNANLKEGNWIGFVDETLMAGACAYSLCTFNNQRLAESNLGLFILPKKLDELETFICGDNRQGMLCGLCATGYTVYYNSPTVSCEKETHLCSYGIVFYFLSEIIPVTVIFLVIIICNIHLTSGSLYSFLFYAQTIDVFKINGFGAVTFNGFFRYVFLFYKFFYSIFNLNCFNAEKLPFCFKKGMTTFDILLIDYLTLFYALFLIFATILILKVNSLYACIKLCHKCGRRDIRGSVINGLTAFVVLCYFKCIVLTCTILIPSTIYIKGTKAIKMVPLFNGHLDYMKGDHLKYAIPAIICLIVIILPPPILLLTESFLLGLNRCFKIRRNYITYLLHKIRLKVHPFLDSFQACFRNNCRCFAGFFLVYRILLLTPFLFSGRLTQDYVSVEIIIFCILILHFLCHPFQRPLHNKIDILLLINLLLVNMLTILHYHMTSLGHYDKQFYNFIISVQFFFVSLPAGYAFIYCIYRIAKKLKLVSHISGKLIHELQQYRTFSNDKESIDNESLPYRLMVEERNSIVITSSGE